MRLALVFLAAPLLVACEQSASQLPSNSSGAAQSAGASQATTGDLAANAPSNESPLKQGMYEWTVVEWVAGVATGPERRDQECVSADMAAHPETFLPPSLSGCTGDTPIRDGLKVRSELRCADNHVLSINTTLSSEGWEQSVSGASEHGSYESRETARRIGDC